jgi:hypothetical protein
VLVLDQEVEREAPGAQFVVRRSRAFVCDCGIANRGDPRRIVDAERNGERPPQLAVRIARIFAVSGADKLEGRVDCHLCKTHVRPTLAYAKRQVPHQVSVACLEARMSGRVGTF